MMNDIDYLICGFKSLNIDIDERKAKNFIKFKDLLLEWNEKINLTTITEINDIYIKHFFDSVTCISTEYIGKNASVIDVGTGAGFPGIPIKLIREDIELVLLDSLNKRINYLNDIIDKIGIDKVKTVHARAEEGGQNELYREKFDIALSRAVANMSTLCEYCIPFVKIGGYFLCQKGPSYKEELESSKNAIKVLGADIVNINEYKLPYSDIAHYIIIMQKISDTPTKYPRKAGKPSSNPIK